MTRKQTFNAIQIKAIDLVIAGHGATLAHSLAEQLGVSRATASRYVKKCVESGRLKSTGGTRPVYELGPIREIFRSYSLPGIDESIIWIKDFSPFFDLADNIRTVVEHGFTEMVNNANDHSEGGEVAIWMVCDETKVSIMIKDDGVGIFGKITKALDLPDPRLSLLELAKGKFTTAPDAHSGEGIFFTSRMFDAFQILSDDLLFSHHADRKHDQLFDAELPANIQSPGTTVLMELAVNSPTTTESIFKQYSTVPNEVGDNWFDRTVVPMKMAKIGDENLVSRSQAKRLVSRFGGFKSVVLDYAGIGMIGQAFADQVYRVFANEHPGVALKTLNANEAVTQMVKQAMNARMKEIDAT